MGAGDDFFFTGGGFSDWSGGSAGNFGSSSGGSFFGGSSSGKGKDEEDAQSKLRKITAEYQKKVDAEKNFVLAGLCFMLLTHMSSNWYVVRREISQREISLTMMLQKGTVVAGSILQMFVASVPLLCALFLLVIVVRQEFFLPLPGVDFIDKVSLRLRPA